MTEPREKHTDILDVASELTTRMNDSYVAEARKKSAPEQVKRPDGTWPTTECEDCGVTIPPARLDLGKVRCVDCQGHREKMAWHRR